MLGMPRAVGVAAVAGGAAAAGGADGGRRGGRPAGRRAGRRAGKGTLVRLLRRGLAAAAGIVASVALGRSAGVAGRAGAGARRPADSGGDRDGQAAATVVIPGPPPPAAPNAFSSSSAFGSAFGSETFDLRAAAPLSVTGLLTLLYHSLAAAPGAPACLSVAHMCARGLGGPFGMLPPLGTSL